jgi:hypothetical protein
MIKAKTTSPNRTVYAAPAVTGLASIRLGHGLRHAHASFRHILPALQIAQGPISGLTAYKSLLYKELTDYGRLSVGSEVKS